jgi:hypothetical protein
MNISEIQQRMLYQTWISDSTVTDYWKELDLMVDGMLFIIRILRIIGQCVSNNKVSTFYRKNFEDN